MSLNKNKLPIYDATITDIDCGVFCVSLVSNPATQVDFVYFDENKPLVKFAVENTVERMVSGVIMLADTPIYRRTADNFEYYVRYSKDTLKLMAEKMIFDGVGSNVNIQHEDGSNVDGVNLVELFIIDREKNIDPSYFSEVPNGSLIGTYKVHNDDVWAMIEKGEVLSFSLEGMFQMISTNEEFNKQNKNNSNMRLNKVKAMLRSLLVAMGEIATDNGVLTWDGDEDIKVGDEVKKLDENGDEIVAEDGDYVTEDKKTIVVKDGKVEEIKEAEEAPVEEPVEEPTEEPIATEEEPVEEPVKDDKDAKIAELEEVIKAKDAEIEELKAKIAELENEPAAASAGEAFEKAQSVEDNTVKGKMAKRGYKFQ